MSLNPQILVLIPARGGSKGIPRKNLRPLNGHPLIYYSIMCALSSAFNLDVFVTTDDDEIDFFSRKIGARVIKRKLGLANDQATLDPVIIDGFHKASALTGTTYDLVVTMQPTSPLLTCQSLDSAINKALEDFSIDTIISAIGDRHLTWRKDDGQFYPNYAERVNRQYLPLEYKETGGFLIAKPKSFIHGSRIGENVILHEVSQEEAIDIDDYNDWALCEYYLRRKKILFVVSGYPEIGLGHVYNCLGLANEILNHRVQFLVDHRSRLGYEKIKENNYSVSIQISSNIIDDINNISPDLIINDRLDTDAEYMESIKNFGYSAINIEDLGAGARYADSVINAIYPEQESLPNHYYGAEYFCARDEFRFHPSKQICKSVRNVLISFGGVDPSNLTKRVLDSIYDYCQMNKVSITVIAGLGYANYDSLLAFDNINIEHNVKNISDYFFSADLVFASAGRTVYELAILGTPTIVLAQNERELTHFYAYEEFGFINLGLGSKVGHKDILKKFVDYADDFDMRKEMSKRMLQKDIANGKNRIIQIINDTLN